MSKCKYETKNGRCGLKGSYAYRHKCFTEDLCKCHEPMTNADRIRAMTDEELVDFLGHNSLCDRIQDDGGDWCKKHPVCKGCMVEWLQQPAEGDA